MSLWMYYHWVNLVHLRNWWEMIGKTVNVKFVGTIKCIDVCLLHESASLLKGPLHIGLTLVIPPLNLVSVVYTSKSSNSVAYPSSGFSPSH